MFAHKIVLTRRRNSPVLLLLLLALQLQQPLHSGFRHQQSFVSVNCRQATVEHRQPMSTDDFRLGLR